MYDGGGRVHAFIYFINIIEEEEDGATAIRARANTLYAHTLWSFFNFISIRPSQNRKVNYKIMFTKVRNNIINKRET